MWKVQALGRRNFDDADRPLSAGGSRQRGCWRGKGTGGGGPSPPRKARANGPAASTAGARATRRTAPGARRNRIGHGRGLCRPPPAPHDGHVRRDNEAPLRTRTLGIRISVAPRNRTTPCRRHKCAAMRRRAEWRRFSPEECGSSRQALPAAEQTDAALMPAAATSNVAQHHRRAMLGGQVEHRGANARPSCALAEQRQRGGSSTCVTTNDASTSGIRTSGAALD